MFGKLIVVAAVALATVQCVPTKESTELNLNLLVENGAVLGKTFFKSVNMALDTMKPNFDNILHEMATELQEIIRDGVAEGRDNIDAQEIKFTHVFSTLMKTLKDLEPIQKCSTKMSPNAKKWALTIEKNFAAAYKTITKKYMAEIDRVKEEFANAMAKGMKIFDQGISTTVKCLTPGRKDSRDCINDVVEQTMSESMSVGAHLLNLKTHADELFYFLSEKGMEMLAPKFLESMVELKNLLGNLADCVSSL